MGRVSKGFAVTTAVFGVLAFVFGLGVSISSWKLSSKVKDFYMDTSDQVQTTTTISFNNYWWGGLFYCVPGILGITVGCTRNVCAMIFYLILNLICMLCSVLVSVFIALLIVAWALVETLSNEGQCSDGFLLKECKCTDYNGNTYTVHNMSCSDVKGIQPILSAIIALASISSLIAFIASYVSCCALCNQEQETQGTVIIQPGPGAYQPPANVIVSNNTTMQQQYAQPMQQSQYYPPQYAQQPPMYAPPQPVPTHDKAKLVRNEVI